MSAWWPAPEPRPYAAVRLFCLPYAGGRASMFRPWPAALPASVEVRALALPGREHRHAEPPLDDTRAVIAAAADALEPLVDRPWAVFGHSMGAILGFELVCELRRRGGPAPVLLVVAGHDAPHLVVTGGEIHRLPDAALADELRRLAGTPPEVLADPEVMALLLPALRADFRICETYLPRGDDPLAVPLLVIGALGDAETTPAGIAGWAQHTTATVTHVTLPGDHFFVHRAERALLQAIARELQALEVPA